MKKNTLNRILSLVLAMAMSLTLCVPALAMNSTTQEYTDKGENTEEYLDDSSLLDRIYANGLESVMPVLEKDSLNEYDYIVGIRRAKRNGINVTNISSERMNYIISDAIESELLRRSALPVEVLREQYCYSDDAIRILKSYKGEKLEQNPKLRGALSTLSAALGELVKTSKRVGVIYTWSWDCQPVICLTDCVALSWEGTYTAGGSNNMALDTYNSFATVNYYYTNPNQKQFKYSLQSNNIYRGAYMSFPEEKYIDAWYYWAKYGALFVYTDLVNQNANAPKLYELNTHAEYAHYIVSLSSPTVSFPYGISISFTGKPDIIGARNLRVKP